VRREKELQETDKNGREKEQNEMEQR